MAFKIWRSTSRDPCTVYNRKINFRESGARNGRGPIIGGKGEGISRLVGTGGPVSLQRDSNKTRRIKPAGNQTFQYPCSCRIYAIKCPLRRRPALLLVFLFSIRMSLSLTPSSCRPVTERSVCVRCLIYARVYVHTYAYMYACTCLCIHIFA